MARKDKKVMTSNISTGGERIPPTPEEEAAYEAANPVVREDSAQVTDEQQEPATETTETVTELSTSEQPEKIKAKRGRSKGMQPVSLQPFEFACLKGVWDAIPETSAWDEWVDFADIPKDARSFLGNFNSRGLIEMDLDADEGNRIKRVRITEKGNISVNTPKLKEPTLPSKATQEKRAKAPKEPRAPSASRGQYSNPDHKITILVPNNPRREGTQGYYSFQLYREGMTYDEYIKSPFDATITCSNGTQFEGAKQVHFLWDVQHGFVGVFDSTKEVADPEYWVAKCKTLVTTPGPAPVAKASNVTVLTQPKLSKAEVEAQAKAVADEVRLKEQMEAEAQAEGEVTDALMQSVTS